MHNIEHRWIELRHLDDLAAEQSVIHKLHPTVKLLTTLVFIVTISSFSKYELVNILPMIFYPVVMISLSNIPLRLLASRILILLPFVLLLGILNPFFDETVFLQIGSITITGGILSFISILLRFVLSVLAVFILIATTGMDSICEALSRIGVPRVFVTQISFVYRYIYVLIEEVMKTTRAYSLRAPYSKGIAFDTWGSLIGVLLIRTIDRAKRIYEAMVCRGFDGEIRQVRTFKINKGDIAFFLIWLLFFVIVRIVNIPLLIGTMLLGGYS